MRDFVVVDIETTGLSARRNSITELAAIRLRDGEVRREFQTLVNPQEHIPSFITRLTGINDRMVRDAPTIDRALPKLLRFMGRGVFVAHNAAFDYGFISHNAQLHLNRPFEHDSLCTRRLGNRLLDLPSFRLSSLCSHFEISNVSAHRALADAKATSQVLVNLLGILNEKGINRLDDILRFQYLPRFKVERLLSRA